MPTALIGAIRPSPPAADDRGVSASPACRRGHHEWCEMTLLHPSCDCSCHEQAEVYPAA